MKNKPVAFGVGVGVVKRGQLNTNIISMDVIEKGILHMDRQGFNSDFDWKHL